MIIILFCSAFTGWIISWLTIQLLFSGTSKNKPGIIQAFKPDFATGAGKFFQEEFEHSKILDEKFSDPSLFEKLKPEIEKHVDFFLKEKLATIFPLLYKFMGEKTLLQFKDAFMIEIDLLFPVIIKNYMVSLKGEIRVDKIISEKIQAMPIETIRRAFLKNAKREIFYFKFGATIIGLLMGLVTVLLIRFTCPR